MRVAGLDLSLQGAAAVVVPEDWGIDWARCASLRVGHSLPCDASDADQLGRLMRIKLELFQFLATNGATHVFVEQYAFSRGKSRAHALGELGGVVKVDCLEAGMPVRSVTASAARKLILGRLPPTRTKPGEPKPLGAKLATHTALARMGAPSGWTGDELDAFAVANWGLADLGTRSALIVEQAA